MRLFLLLLVVSICSFCQTTKCAFVGKSDAELHQIADQLAHKYIIFDGHVDLPYRLKAKNFRLEKEFVGLPLDDPKGDFDVRRAKIGGLSAPFMSIYIPSDLQKTGREQVFADSIIRMVTAIAEANPTAFGLVKTTDDVLKNFKKGLISLPMGMENGCPILKIEDVARYHRLGIRYVTLTHGKDNLICDSSYDTTKTWNGLSPFGEKVVLEMNRVGIMVDISHVSDSTFFDVMRLTKVPVIASHSSARKFTPAFQRNMSDDALLGLKKNNGVICINFGSTFLDSEVKAANRENEKLWVKLLTEKGVEDDSPEAEKLKEEFKKTHKNVYSDVQKVADHIDHVRKLIGIDHIGLGSDFDGVGDSLPTGLKDVSMYPNLIFELLKRGYSEVDISKILEKNVLRVWRATEKASANAEI
jgi:membrane dipeptidase